MDLNDRKYDVNLKRAQDLAEDVEIESISYPEETENDELNGDEEVLLLKEIASDREVPLDARKSAISALLCNFAPLERLRSKLSARDPKPKKNTLMSKLFGKTIEKIKRDPEKAMHVVDNLPPRLKKFGMKTFGLFGGAVVGAKMGAMAGSFAGNYLEENQLTDVYKNLKKMNEDLIEKEHQLKETLVKTAKNYIKSQMTKFIRLSFSNKYRRSLEILLLYLFSIMFSVTPIFGKRLSAYISAMLMASSILLFIVGLIRTARSLIPYVISVIRERSVVDGVLIELRKLNEHVAKGEKLLQSMNIELSDRELMPIAREVLMLLRKQIAFYIVGFIMISLGFFLIKQGVILQTTELSAIQIILYPFYALL